jgi:hypothetical protein
VNSYHGNRQTSFVPGKILNGKLCSWLAQQGPATTYSKSLS